VQVDWVLLLKPKQIGQAVRMAQSHGLHTDMQPASVGDRLAQHGRLLWWTVYTLDQRLSSLMGITNGIHDDDISALAPQISENDIHSSALAIHVKISQLLGSITISRSTQKNLIIAKQ
jgi:proline utilization trans-activator